MKVPRHYCLKCRAITEHYPLQMLGEKRIVCENWQQHWNMEWCKVDGKLNCENEKHKTRNKNP